MSKKRVYIEDLNVWNFKDYCRWYRIDKKIFFFFKKVRYAYQRAKYGYCDRDIWNLDYSLGNYISATVAQLAKTTHSYPYGINEEEWIDKLRFISRSFYLGTHEEEWKNPYEEEIFSFPLYNKTPEQEKITKRWLEIEKSNKKAMDIRLQEGLNELSKYFRDLWD